MLKSSCILILNLLVFVIFRNEHALKQMGTIFLVYSVTKILRKIRATTFTEKLRKITREGDDRQG